jgi:FkbM family methyltransferase
MKIKRFLRTILPPGYFDFFRYLKFRIFKNSRCAPYEIDKKLSKYLNFKYGYFVELGANDGFTESATFYLDKKKKWRGILIEPLLDKYLDCCYYRSKIGNTLFCNAVVASYYKNKYVELNYSNLTTIFNNSKTAISNPDNHSEKGLAHLSSNIKSFTFAAKTTTLTKILEKSDAPNIIDFMVIDVEGAELSVLSGINFKKYNFKYLMIECRNLISIKKILKKNGYKLIEKLSHHDYLFEFNKSELLKKQNNLLQI